MKLLLSKKEEVADGTMAFWFEPEKPMQFTAGQFGDFTLTNPPFEDAKGNTRTFSLAGTPGDDRIMIATRMRDSAFKNSLAALPIGSPVQFMGPMGSFTLHKDPARPAVFLTGGIGITPVRSIVEYATIQKLSHRIVLFYSNTTLSRTAFLKDFDAWSKSNANFSFIPTLTDENPDGWAFETSLLDHEMLSRHVSDLHAPIYYVVGPPGMVAAMKKMLEEIGIDDMQIRSEDFAGY